MIHRVTMRGALIHTSYDLQRATIEQATSSFDRHQHILLGGVLHPLTIDYSGLAGTKRATDYRNQRNFRRAERAESAESAEQAVSPTSLIVECDYKMAR